MAAGEEKRRQAVLARIARVRSRLNLEISLRAAVVPAWFAATAFVMWRVFVQRGELLFGGVALVSVFVATWWRSRKRGVSHEAAAVLADKGAGAGGLLLTRLERLYYVERSEDPFDRRYKYVSLTRFVGEYTAKVAFEAIQDIEISPLTNASRKSVSAEADKSGKLKKFQVR